MSELLSELSLQGGSEESCKISFMEKGENISQNYH